MNPGVDRGGRSSAAPGLAPRLLLALATLTLSALVAEGVLSLAAGRSLSETWRARPAVREWLAPTDRDRWLAAAANPGPWRVHEDGRVGLTLRHDSTADVFGVDVRSDGLGLRARPGPPVAADAEAIRIHVLGDSVAFGWGVEDDETLAHRLETHLTAALPAGSPPVVCRTVAIPGWNHRNAVHFLLDHLDELPADVVLFLPVDNDLANSYGVAETGHRREAPDPATPDPWLTVSTDQNHFLVLDAQARLAARGALAGVRVEDLGPEVLEADLTAESRRRLDANADSVRRLVERLAPRGVRVALLQSSEQRYLWHLWARLGGLAGASVPVIPLLKDAEPRFALPTNPHPSAATLDAFALWTARELLARGWVPGGEAAAARLPAVPEAYASARAPVLGPDEWARRSARMREVDLAALRSRVDTATAEGLHQVYGGIQAGRAADRRARLVLAHPPGAERLVVRLAGLPGRDDALPLRVQVVCDDVPLGEVRLDGPEPVDASFPLTGPLAKRAVHEVLLAADRAVVAVHQERRRTSSYAFHHVAVE